MKYKGIVGAWKTEVNTPAVKLLSIVTDTKKTQVIGLMFYPSMKSPIKKSYGSNDCSISSNAQPLKRL
jgi:hypothetical protein